MSLRRTPEPDDAQQLEKLIRKLLLFYKPKTDQPEPLEKEEIEYLIDRVIKDLHETSGLVECRPPITICGDTHGQYDDLIRLFKYSGWPPISRYLFLGDYVDRGPNSIEVICLVFAMKCRYPNGFFILRGNHESPTINRAYGFYDECVERYTEDLWTKFQEAFNCLPIAALVGGKIFCMHGGLSRELHSLQQLREMILPFEAPEADGSLVTDILWSDPVEGVQGYVPSNRGISYLFGEDEVIAFCNKHKLDLIVRAHQVVEDGYKFFANRKLVTIFSAPNYCGEFNNSAGMLSVSESMHVKLRTLKPSNRRQRNRAQPSRSFSPRK